MCPVRPRHPPFLLAALLVAAFAGMAPAGEKIQFSGRNTPGQSGGLRPESKPAFATPDFLNGPRMSRNPSEDFQPVPMVPYSPARSKAKDDDPDRRKDWTFGERDDRDKQTSQDALLERLATDRYSAENRPQTTTDRLLNEQERRLLPISGSATNDALASRKLTDPLERSFYSLNATNRTGAFGNTGGSLTNSYAPFQTGSGSVSLPGAAVLGGPALKDGSVLPQLPRPGAGLNAGFMDSNARLEGFKKMLNSGSSPLSFGSAPNSPAERGTLGMTGSGLPGGQSIGELPSLSGERKGFDLGGGFGGTAAGRPAILNDFNAMRLGAPEPLPAPAQAAEPPHREHKPVSMDIPKRRF